MTTQARSIDEVIKRLNALDKRDRELAHSEADDVLLDALRMLGAHEVAKAWEEACERVGFWYA